MPPRRVPLTRIAYSSRRGTPFSRTRSAVRSLQNLFRRRQARRALVSNNIGRQRRGLRNIPAPVIRNIMSYLPSRRRR